jgi:hypothetical protein
MGLDIYVGSLTRYYSFTWQTAAEQYAKAHGWNIEVVRPPHWSPPTVDEARARVMAWQLNLSHALGVTLGWDEDAEAPYEVDKPDWDCYHALRYFALHEEFPELPTPRTMPSRGPFDFLEKEPLEQRYGQVYSGQKPKGLRGLFGGRSGAMPEPRYPHLQTPQLWIPADLPGPFCMADPMGTPIVLGSVPRLRAELESLNDRTLRLDQAGIDAIRRGEVPDGDFMDAAKFGFVIFLTLARIADHRNLPIKSDY